MTPSTPEPTCLCNATITPANQHDVEAHLNEHQSFLHQQLEEVCAANKKYVERFEEVRKENDRLIKENALLKCEVEKWKDQTLANARNLLGIESTPEGDKGE